MGARHRHLSFKSSGVPCWSCQISLRGVAELPHNENVQAAQAALSWWTWISREETDTFRKESPLVDFRLDFRREWRWLVLPLRLERRGVLLVPSDDGDP